MVPLQKLNLMAVLNRKEEKLQVVLGRLPKNYTDEEFVAMFMKLYPKDWGKIKSTYIKQSQDKEPGTVINMPKPALYLKQILQSYLQKEHAALITEIKVAPINEKTKSIRPKKEPTEVAPKAKTTVKKKASEKEAVDPVKKTKKLTVPKADIEPKTTKIKTTKN